MQPKRGCSTIVAAMSLDQLRTAAGPVATDVGTLLPIPDLIRLGADKDAFLAILEDGTGNLIELGKFKRNADLRGYLGLVASQGVDMTPGSNIPAAQCDIHHVESWSSGGRSTADNLALVSPATHRKICDQKKDSSLWWTYCSRTGHILFRPPDTIDPLRRPRMNINPDSWFVPGQIIRMGGVFPPESEEQRSGRVA